MGGVVVPETFIDNVLPNLRGDAVRVYLYASLHPEAGITDIADKLNLMDRDVIRTFRLLEQGGVRLAGRSAAGHDMKKLFMAVRKVKGADLSKQDAELVYRCVKNYNFSDELVEFLYQRSATACRLECGYLSRVADDWAARGFTRKEEAEEYLFGKGQLDE